MFDFFFSTACWFIHLLETQMDMIKKETQDYRSRCSAEAKKIVEDIQLADHDVGIMEREAAEVLKVKSGFLFFL